MINNKTMKRSKPGKRGRNKKMAYHGSTSTSFTLTGGNDNDVITDYVNPQLRKAQLRGNVNVATTHNGARPDASTNGARAVNLVV